ncbi:MAG: Hsp70 family protein [Deltaproteobacteria bacterium]|nr:Hsp70 family protein [Deltaproteobacteria bacterium]
MSVIARPILGIDLGTTFSTAAVFSAGEIRLVADERGESCIPTVVHLSRHGRPVVGTEALRMIEVEPEQTVTGIKRLLGRQLSDPGVRLFEASSAVRVAPTQSGDAGLRLRDGVHPAAEVASWILRLLKERAERLLGCPVERAIVTLPASATSRTQAATIQAARIAGLHVERTIPEPCAAALAAGLTRFQGQRRVMVYDFGGGTFDVSVLEQRGTTFRVLATGGDECLGGDDFDERLARSVATTVWSSHRVELARDRVRWGRVLRQAERVKRALSSRPEAQLKLAQAYSFGGRWYDIDLMIRRPEMEPQWAELVTRSITLSAETLLRAGMRPEGLAGIVLVGGTSNIPLVKQRVAQVFGRPTTQSEFALTAVAQGAAMLGAQVVDLEQRDTVEAPPDQVASAEMRIGR